VLITDLSMPGDKYGDGITLIKYIKRHFPDISIIVLTMNNNPAILSAVLDLDIEGIVLKQGAPTDLPKALAALQKGKKFTLKAFHVCWKKSARVATVTNACHRKE
jgi:two-component system capsular synthesis response regulator RcsB